MCCTDPPVVQYLKSDSDAVPGSGSGAGREGITCRSFPLLSSTHSLGDGRDREAKQSKCPLRACVELISILFPAAAASASTRRHPSHLISPGPVRPSAPGLIITTFPPRTNLYCTNQGSRTHPSIHPSIPFPQSRDSLGSSIPTPRASWSETRTSFESRDTRTHSFPQPPHSH